MPFPTRRRALRCGLAAALAPALHPALVHAQDRAQDRIASYPTDNVRMVVPYAAGGATDIVARAVAEKLHARWSKPVVIDNRPGAGTTLAAAQVARGPGDGHLLYMTTSAHTISSTLYKKLDYDPLKDFAALSLIAKVPLVLVVRPDLGVGDLAGFIRHAQAYPDKANFASPGNGTAQHLAGEMFNTATRSRLVHVPYKGDAPAITDLMGGSVDAMFATLTVVLPHIASGRLKAIALANGRRVEKVPGIPTFAESGLAGFEAATWFGVLAPASLAPPLRERIAQDLRAVVGQPELRARLIDLGGEVVSSTPAEFDAFMQAETRKWQDIVRQSGAAIG
ncbi:tripartite tricarboxylate transporter substrate binding protein [Delftia acidovorans]|uniref:tripartite tricarboxylate transporter substrate binding protein n=1 Tax=Delftia acidovorans TaxID=80866 RepID=UPI0030193BD4